jgi:hypothetical protein
MFDVIGDIHGQGDALIALLEKLGYRQEDGAYRHPDREVIFVGDFVDRGPKVRLVLETVRAMCDAGTARAVMGNHEFNMIAYHTPDGRDGHLRPHTEKNQKQTRATLEQLSEHERMEWVEWFRKLPMWLEEDGLRVVHASWVKEQIDIINQHRGQAARLPDAFLAEACQRGSELYAAIEDVLKGTEVTLPDGLSFLDKDGHRRTAARTRWYADASRPGLTWQDYGFTFRDKEREAMPAEELPDELRERAGYPADAPPVIFGHYWVPPDERHMRPLAPNVACVDFSAGKGGMLAAYRWDGEAKLSAEKYVAVSAS